MATLAILIVFGGAAGFAAANEPDAWLAVPILSIIGSVLMLIALTLSVPGIIGELGGGLLKRKAWARILMIVLSALNLINIPLGTLLGIYGLWVLLSRDTELLFREASTSSESDAATQKGTTSHGSAGPWPCVC